MERSRTKRKTKSKSNKDCNKLHIVADGDGGGGGGGARRKREPLLFTLFSCDFVNLFMIFFTMRCHSFCLIVFVVCRLFPCQMNGWWMWCDAIAHKWLLLNYNNNNNSNNNSNNGSNNKSSPYQYNKFNNLNEKEKRMHLPCTIMNFFCRVFIFFVNDWRCSSPQINRRFSRRRHSPTYVSLYVNIYHTHTHIHNYKYVCVWVFLIRLEIT